MSISIPTGVFDILPNDPKEPWRNSYLWQFLEAKIREHAYLYNCHEIRTPIFERTELFQRSVGDETDIVSKEMYTFLDRGERSMSLRPEGTAAVMRSVIEKQLYAQAGGQRLFYIGPMFRYERPQAGRYRQHHQFGVEMIGSNQPLQDAEIIEMLFSLYQKLGLKDLTVNLNCLGDKEARARFRQRLCEYLRPYLSSMSPESQRRFEVNPLRILDSKNEEDKRIVAGAPSILDCLTPESRSHFDQVCSLLQESNIPFQVDSKLVRGLDYYNGTVFEITYGPLGAQNTIGAGGRYDGLLKELGGPDLPTIGFATGIERVLQTLIQQKLAQPEVKRPVVYIIPMGELAARRCLSLVTSLRQKGISCQLDVSGKKVKQCMQQADLSKAQFTIVLGEDELAQNACDLKHMETGNKIRIPLDQIADLLSFSAQFKELQKNSVLLGDLPVYLENNEEAQKLMELKRYLDAVLCSIGSIPSMN